MSGDERTTDTPLVDVPDRICDDDGTSNWFRADRYTRTRARREVADEAAEPVGAYTARKMWMRQATRDDAEMLGLGDWQLEVGWWLECERTEPGAFPVWRVDG